MLRRVEQVGAPSGAPTCSTEHLNRAELDFRFGTGEPAGDRADYAAMSHDQGYCGTMRDYAGPVARGNERTRSRAGWRGNGRAIWGGGVRAGRRGRHRPIEHREHPLNPALDPRRKRGAALAPRIGIAIRKPVTVPSRELEWVASANLVCRQPLEKPEIDLDEFVDCDRRAHRASDNARAFARPL